MDSDSQADSGGYSDEVLRRGLSDCRKRFWMRKDFKDQQRGKHFGEVLLAREASILVGFYWPERQAFW